MVADALVYHPSVSHYLKYVATTVGRDKVLRLFQYFARFYSWYLFRLNATAAEVAPYNAMKSTFGTVRKIMRLGKFVEHIKAAAQAFDAKTGPGGMDPFLRYCAIGRQLGYAGYMSLDHIHILHATGIKKNQNAAKLIEIGYRCWLTGLSFNTIAGAYQLLKLRQKRTQLDLKEGEGVVEAKRIERERAAVNLQLLSDVCDMTVPAFALGYSFLDDGIVGLAGVTSSLIGIYSVWQKTA